MIVLLVALGLTQRATISVPKGFRLVAETEVENALTSNAPESSSDIECYVRLDGKKVVFLFEDRKHLPDEKEAEETRKRLESYPGKIVLEGGAAAYENEQTATKVEDGWLCSVDIGEWGGGVYFFDKGWKNLTRLYKGNVQPICRMADGLYALGGSDYVRANSGVLLKIERGKEGWKVDTVASIGPSAQYAARLDSQHLLIVQDGLRKVGLDGKVELMCPLPDYLRFPTSVALATDGTVYLTAGRFVAAIKHVGATYLRAWFEPVTTTDPPQTVNSPPIYGLPADLRS